MKLTVFDWLRIRSALLSAANDLATTSSDQELDYLGTYHAVKKGLAALIDFPQKSNVSLITLVNEEKF
jgi:hypothetical protein